jgi:hypothetical protein
VSFVDPPEGFKAVFNGHNLDGWEGSEKYWSVEDVGPPMTIRYKDFFLKALPDDLPLIKHETTINSSDARKVAPQGQDKPRKPDAE